MSTTKAKSTKALTEPLKTQPTIEPAREKTIINKSSKKPLAATANAVTEIIGKVEKIENTVTALTKKAKSDKTKVIKDSFSFPEQDYLKISELKKICLTAGIPVKKGELLRAGLHLLAKLNLAELKHAVEQVEKVKTGRPNASKLW